jgi:hypothetical protein
MSFSYHNDLGRISQGLGENKFLRIDTVRQD